MATSSQTTPAQPKAIIFSTTRNPFNTHSDWDPATLSQIKIMVTEPVETTGEFTKAKFPTDRHWKSSVEFSFGSFLQDKLKISNIDIPYADKQNYGAGYVYACINKHVGEAIKEAAGKAGYILNIDEERVVSTGEQWWKTVNKIDGNFGTLGQDGFVARSLQGILEKTKKGVMVQAELKFFIKLHTKDMKNKDAGSVYRLGAEVVRMYAKAIARDIQMPTILPKPAAGSSAAASNEPPVVSRTDVAPDDLLADLASMGL